MTMEWKVRPTTNPLLYDSDRVMKEIRNDIKSEVAMKELMADGHIEDSFTDVPETWVVVESQRETQEMEGGIKEKD